MNTKAVNESLLASLLSPEGVSVAPEGFAMPDASWDALISLARRHGLAPQLYDQILRSGRIKELPGPVSLQLKREYLAQAVKGLRLSAALSEILSHLGAIGLPVIVLKGPHLAEIVYHDWALRPMADFDLLIKKADADRAIASLRELGYEPLNPALVESCPEEHRHLPPLTKKGAPRIELHLSLEMTSLPFCIDTEGLWQRAQKTTIAGVQTLVLSDEDLLTHLSIHLSYSHRFSYGLLPLADISRLLKRATSDFRHSLRTRAEQWGALKCLFLTLAVCRELFGASDKGEFIDSLRPEGMKQELLDQALELVCPSAVRQFDMTENLRRVWQTGTVLDRMKIVARRIFLPPRSLAAMYRTDPESSLIYLYYAVRVIDLLKRYFKTIFALLRKDRAALSDAEMVKKSCNLIEWLISK